MCQYFSCLITENGKALWKIGIDSHEDLFAEFNIENEDRVARVEVVPSNDDRTVSVDKWEFVLDEERVPTWWKPEYEKVARFAAYESTNFSGMVEFNNCRKWYKNGKLHRIGEPAMEYFGWYKAWMKNGKLHREDGPAVEYSNGNKRWYKDDKLIKEYKK